MVAFSVPAQPQTGFDGSVTGLVLADVIQLKVQNRFCGCIIVNYKDRNGKIFFRDGDVIHAEIDDEFGPKAFYEIISWPGGTFNLDAKVTTTQRSINDSCQYLLMEAYRLMDEKQNLAELAKKQQAASTPADGRVSMDPLHQRLMKVPGVAHTVVMNKEGTPVSDDSFASETLAAQAQYLTMVADLIGEAFAAGNIKAAAVEGSERHMLIFESKQHYLSISLEGSANLAAAESEVRKVLTTK